MAQHSGLPVFLSINEISRKTGASRHHIERAFAFRGLAADALMQFGMRKQPLIREDRLAEVIPLLRTPASEQRPAA